MRREQEGTEQRWLPDHIIVSLFFPFLVCLWLWQAHQLSLGFGGTAPLSQTLKKENKKKLPPSEPGGNNIITEWLLLTTTTEQTQSSFFCLVSVLPNHTGLLFLQTKDPPKEKNKRNSCYYGDSLWVVMYSPWLLGKPLIPHFLLFPSLHVDEQSLGLGRDQKAAPHTSLSVALWKPLLLFMASST